MKSKEELIDELCQVMEHQGSLTVLHTHAIASRIGLSATEFECLDVIRRNQPITAGQLATLCGLSTGAITGIVDRLEKAGFAVRKVSSEDRRRVLLCPVRNRDMACQVRELYLPLLQAFDRIVGDLTTDQLQFLVDGHSKMNDAMQEIIIELNKK